MQATYRLRLDPNQIQLAILEKWQGICCYVTNRMLGDRESTYLMQKTLGDYCSLHDKKLYTVTSLRSNLKEKYVVSGLYCSVNRNASLGYPWKTGDVKRARPSNKKNQKKSKKEPSPKRSAYEMQSSYLPELKKLKPEIAEVNAFVLQKQCDKLDKAFQKFFKGEAKYPRYKKPHEIGFEFEPKTVAIDLGNNRITLSGLGSVRFFNSREWWDGLTIRKTSVTYKGGNWYVNILVRDDSIPDTPVKSHEEVTTVIGGDMGIKKLLSKLHVVVPPHHTSQKCSNCNHCAKGNRQGEKFICEECGYYTDADNNAALNIANKGIEQERLNSNKVRQVMSELTPKINVRRYHQPFGLMSRGIAEFKGYPEKRILRKVISSDSHPELTLQDG